MMPTVWPFAAGFFLTAILVPLLISWQRRRNLGQQIYDDGPKTHAAKSGTPTLGGLAFLIAALAGFAFGPSPAAARLLFLVASVGAIGAVDDLLIIWKRRALGLKARWKLLLLAIVAFVYLWQTAYSGGFSTRETWFGGDVVLPVWLWWVLAAGAIVGGANAVNLTDGLDGLAAGTAIVPLLVLSLAALSPLSASVLGAIIAFLWFNRHPARIFMGDTGSLLLGALMAGDAIASGWLLILPLIGIVYVVEALSVVAQVASFKLTGKRILKMSPLHHHFELSGWSEWHVTSVFIAASAAATAAVITLHFLFGAVD